MLDPILCQVADRTYYCHLPLHMMESTNWCRAEIELLNTCEGLSVLWLCAIELSCYNAVKSKKLYFLKRFKTIECNLLMLHKSLMKSSARMKSGKVAMLLYSAEKSATTLECFPMSVEQQQQQDVAEHFAASCRQNVLRGVAQRAELFCTTAFLPAR